MCRRDPHREFKLTASELGRVNDPVRKLSSGAIVSQVLTSDRSKSTKNVTVMYIIGKEGRWYGIEQ